MDPQPILFLSLINRKIADVLAEYPQLVKVFMRSRTACIGCAFSAYCVLRDALDVYQLDPAVVLREISNTIEFEN